MTQQQPNRGRGNDRAALKKSNLETLRGMLQKMERQLTAALPKHVTAERMIRIATTTVQRVPKLLECDPVTVVGSIMQSAQLGLEPDNVTGAAYLVPFWNTKNNRHECNLIPGYRGLMMLARRSREIQAFDARVVKRGDLFEFEYGSRQYLKHKPGGLADIAMKRAGGKQDPAATFEIAQEEQPTIAAYMIAFFGREGSQFQVMTRADLERAKQFTKSRNRDGEITGPWIEHPDAMFTKTVIRRGAKLLPFSVELQTAVALDERHEAGKPQNMGLVAADYLGVEFEPSTEDDSDGADNGDSGPAPSGEQIRETEALFDRLDLPEAKRTVLLQEYRGRTGDLIEWLRAEVAKPVGSVTTKAPADVRADRDREDAKAEPTKPVEAPAADDIFRENKPAPREPEEQEQDTKPAPAAPRASKRSARFQI